MADRIVEMESVIAEIRAIFDNVRLEDGVNLHEAREIDNYGSPEEILSCHRKVVDDCWQDIPDKRLQRYHDVHPFLCPKGFRFYIPAFMMWMLRGLGTDAGQWNFSTLSSLTLPTEEKSFYSYHVARYELLNAAESKAVCRFLRFLERWSDDNRQRAEIALERYWGRFCRE